MKVLLKGTNWWLMILMASWAADPTHTHIERGENGFISTVQVRCAAFKLNQFLKSAKILPPKNAAPVCGSAAPYRQLQVKKRVKKLSIWQILPQSVSQTATTTYNSWM